MEFRVNDIVVFYDSCMDGGGPRFGQDYLSVIRRKYPGRTFKHCYEWCSGPGFIGFALFAHGLVHKLTVSDCYEPAINGAVATTIAMNHLDDYVDAYLADSLSLLPKDLKFDLVVANPPHYLECPGDDNYQRIAVDLGWRAHRDFFAHIGQHLTEDGVILLQENRAGSLNGVEDFREMIEHNGLYITDHYNSIEFFDTNGPMQIYYIEIRARV